MPKQEPRARAQSKPVIIETFSHEGPKKARAMAIWPPGSASRFKLENRHAQFAYCLRYNDKIKFRVGKHQVSEHMKTAHEPEMVVFF